MSVQKKQSRRSPKACPPPMPDLCAGLQDFYMCRRRVSPPTGGETMTEQHHKAHVDVNNIMARYTRSGVMDHIRTFEGRYADITDMDYHESMTKVAEAKSMFEELPSTMRRHFSDDVSQFLAYCVQEDDPESGLQAIAEEYRKQALGIGNGESVGDKTVAAGTAAHAEGPQDADKDVGGEG